jgi:hypothetical protein
MRVVDRGLGGEEIFEAQPEAVDEIGQQKVAGRAGIVDCHVSLR